MSESARFMQSTAVNEMSPGRLSFPYLGPRRHGRRATWEFVPRDVRLDEERVVMKLKTLTWWVMAWLGVAVVPSQGRAQVCPQTSEIERNQCYLLLAVEEENPSLCTNIIGSAQVDCYQYVARTTGVAACGTIEYQFAQAACHQEAMIGFQERLEREEQERWLEEQRLIELEQLEQTQEQSALLQEQLAAQDELEQLLLERDDKAAEIEALREEIERLQARAEQLLTGDGDQGAGGERGGDEDGDSDGDEGEDEDGFEGGPEGDGDEGFEDEGDFEDELPGDEGGYGDEGELSRSEPPPTPPEPQAPEEPQPQP